MQLPDKRLYPVMDKFIDRISQKQSLSMRKLANTRKEEIQFGRFLGNQRVSFTHFQSHNRGLWHTGQLLQTQQGFHSNPSALTYPSTYKMNNRSSSAKHIKKNYLFCNK